MKKTILYTLVLFVMASCTKRAESLPAKDAGNAPAGFTTYIIRKGAHYAEGNDFKTVSVSEMKFIVQFDSSAIYSTASVENQYDINKLYGFSDNNTDHHQNSARIGWRWSDGALRLFAYVYNGSKPSSREISAVPIGSPVNCAIDVMKGSYVFVVGQASVTMPRESTTEKGSGYQLYPYFGGDEPAPHDISIRIKPL